MMKLTISYILSLHLSAQSPLHPHPKPPWHLLHKHNYQSPLKWALVPMVLLATIATIICQIRMIHH